MCKTKLTFRNSSLADFLDFLKRSLNTPERFLEYRFEGRRILGRFLEYRFEGRLLEAKPAVVCWNRTNWDYAQTINNRFFWLPFTIGFLVGFFQLSALDIWISDFVRHWILNTEFLLQYLAAHVIPALRLGVRFLFRSGTIQLGNFLEWEFLVGLVRMVDFLKWDLSLFTIMFWTPISTSLICSRPARFYFSLAQDPVRREVSLLCFPRRAFRTSFVFYKMVSAS
ncbi:hypothetical protein RhiirB3_453065 [Rhizophagus irregularis]|nr:hypothetical protein RhiirB3_453065 [Rhizophagus irregularis]